MKFSCVKMADEVASVVGLESRLPVKKKRKPPYQKRKRMGLYRCGAKRKYFCSSRHNDNLKDDVRQNVINPAHFVASQ